MRNVATVSLFIRVWCWSVSLLSGVVLQNEILLFWWKGNWISQNAQAGGQGGKAGWDEGLENISAFIMKTSENVVRRCLRWFPCHVCHASKRTCSSKAGGPAVCFWRFFQRWHVLETKHGVAVTHIKNCQIAHWNWYIINMRNWSICKIFEVHQLKESQSWAKCSFYVQLKDVVRFFCCCWVNDIVGRIFQSSTLS